jgi:diaminopimelate decarboxylase
LHEKELLRSLIDEYGSPINIHNKSEFHENILSFQELGERLNLDLEIFFARKANKCKTFVSEVKKGAIGLDTASYRELADS